jgi:biopolymer transport protein ExbB/TolQ
MAEERVLNEVVNEEVSGARPNTDANFVIQFLVGIVGTIAISVAVLPLKNASPGIAYIYGIINDRGPVQYLELIMAFMVAALVFLKAGIIRNQLRIMAEGPVSDNLDLGNDEEVTNLRRKLRSDDAYEWSILLNRAERMLTLWLGSKDISRVATWSATESERDMSGSDSSYAIARVLIWAIPILGFIGTVMGLGSAVSGFSEFLAGEAELSAIKEAIGDVTIGLGVAFDTTLLALVLSVILMFPLSIIQRREENLFVEIDNYLDDMLLSRFPAPESQPIVIENLEDSIEAAFRRYIPDPDRYEEVFTNAIDRAAGTVEERFGLLARNYETTLNELTARMSSSVATVGDTIEMSMRKIVEDVQSEENAFLERRKQLSAQEMEQFKKMGDDIFSTSAQIADKYRQSADALQQTTQQASEKSLSAAQDLAQRMEEVVKLASGIQDLLKIEQAVEKGLAGISASGELQQTLHTLRDHLHTTDEFCKRLSKPRVITLREEVS